MLSAEYCETVSYYDEDYRDYHEGSATITIGGTTYGGNGGSKTSPIPSPFNDEELAKIDVVKNWLNLSRVEKLWIDKWENGQYAFKLHDFGAANMWSDEAIAFAYQAFVALMNGEIESIDDVIYVIEAAQDPIENMEDYLDCFDTTQSASLTIYVNEPKDGSNNLIGLDDRVGHTFVSIQQSDNVASYGFYPKSALSSIFRGTQGEMEDNSNTEYDVSLTINNISPSSLEAIINLSKRYAISDYHLSQRNCTDMGIALGNLAGLQIPECNANPIYFFGSTPGRLGEYMRNLTLPNGVTRNRSGGNSPNNNCN